MSKNLIITLVFLVLLSCNENYFPKPRMYYRIDFPEKKYKKYETDCPYIFNYPDYATVQSDSSKFSEPCWVNINLQQLNGQIYISYKNINGNLNEMIEDSRTLAYKHSVKADKIDEKIFINKDKRVFGTMYEIKGNAASASQFYLTDSTSHFLRGSLYFNVYPNKDSLAPVIDFVQKDIIYFIETFEWK